MAHNHKKRSSFAPDIIVIKRNKKIDIATLFLS